MRLKTELLAFAMLISIPTVSSQAKVVDFDDLNAYTVTGLNGSYFDGHGGGASLGSWETEGVTFNTRQFGPGWSYSNVNDVTTPGFGNQWAAITGTDVSGTGNYVIGNSFSPGGAFFNLDGPTVVNSVSVTNATYTALSIENGDGFAKEFGGVSGDDPDLFTVTFTGHSDVGATGTVTGTREYILADYRFADNSQDFIVDTWQLVDLTSLGTVRSVSIGFFSTDVGGFGINTPTYVAIDNLSITAVPEPGSFAFFGIAGAGLIWRRRRRTTPV